MPLPRLRSPRRASFAPIAEILEARHLLAGPAGLDTGFGVGGSVVPPGLSSNRSVVAVQPDGKILAMSDNAIARLNADGSVDASFGVGGIAAIPTTPLFAGSNAFSPSVLRLAHDGKIVVGGSLYQVLFPDILESTFLIARLNADGSPDSGFGQGGVATAPLLRSVDPASGQVVDDPAMLNTLALAADGSIVAAGYDRVANGLPYSGFPTGGDWVVARFRADGAIDAGFGSGGLVTLDFGMGPELTQQVQSVAIGVDGTIFLGGYTQIAPVNEAREAAALAKLHPDGSPDSGFGPGGLFLPTTTDPRYPTQTTLDGRSVLISIGGVEALLPHPDGSVVAALSSADLENRFAAIFKVDAGGHLDPNFGPIDPTTGARNPAPRVLAAIPRVATLGDGSLVVSGFVTTTTPGTDASHADSTTITRFNATQILPDGTTGGTFSTLTFDSTTTPEDPFSAPLPFNSVDATAVDGEGRLLLGGPIKTGTHVTQMPYQGILIPRVEPVFSFGFTRLLTSFVATAPPTVLDFNVLIPKRRLTMLGLTVSFSAALDPATANAVTSYQLVSAGRDRRFGTRDDRTLALTSATFDPTANRVSIVPKLRLSRFLPLQLRIPSGVLRDLHNQPLGGTTGGDFVATFNPRLRAHAVARIAGHRWPR